ncbi:MAG TPA: hypothetical protein PLR41_01785 [Alphaproteobacteria bacterium]|nr:hypothetical protein [Alphaproteobacteria bacterium]
MRVLPHLLLVGGMAAALSACSMDYIPGLLPPPPHASDTPRVAAYYNPNDHRVLMDNPAGLEYAPVVMPQ